MNIRLVFLSRVNNENPNKNIKKKIHSNINPFQSIKYNPYQESSPEHNGESLKKNIRDNLLLFGTNTHYSLFLRFSTTQSLN